MSDGYFAEQAKRWLDMMNGKQWPPAEPLAFVSEAKQELLRLIVDVQQNRNRPEDLA